MKKMIFAVIAVLIIATGLYLTLQSPELAGYVGGIFGLALILGMGAMTVYLRTGGVAESRRNRLARRRADDDDDSPLDSQ